MHPSSKHAERMRPDGGKGSAGFTLIEIIVAFFIFAIIVATLFGSYRSVFSHVADIDEVNSLYEMAENCLGRMVQDLRSLQVSIPPAYRPPDMNDPVDPYRFSAESIAVAGTDFPRLGFASLAHLRLGNSPADGIAKITYYVRPDENGSFVLRRSDQLYPFGPFVEQRRDPILCRGLKSLSFYFVDAEGQQFERWDSDAKDFGHATPRGVGIRLEIGEGRQALFMETYVVLPVFRNRSD